MCKYQENIKFECCVAAIKVIDIGKYTGINVDIIWA